jgi:hypothetical protein
MIARFQGGDSLSDLQDDPCPFVSQNNGQGMFCVPCDHMPIGAADAASEVLDQDFAGVWFFKNYVLDF